MFYAVNYISVIAGAVAAFLVGWLWYGPVFGKQWMAMMGYTKESIASMKMKPMTAMALGFVSSLVMAYVVAVFAGLWVYDGFYGAFKFAFWVWLGFIATVSLGPVLWENRSWKLYCFNAVYQFVALFVMTLVIVLWS